MLRFILATVLLAAALCGCDPVDDPLPLSAIVVADAQLSTLERAVNAAGLAEALSGDGPLTLFAPTDAAFAILFEATEITEADLLARADLTDVLLRHLSAGALASADLTPGRSVPTQGGPLTVVADEDGTLGLDRDGDGVADARFSITDIEASNGVLHKIDAVLAAPE